MKAFAFLSLYLVLPVTAGQLALREFARRGGRPIPSLAPQPLHGAPSHGRVAPRQVERHLTQRVAGYVERLQGMAPISGRSVNRKFSQEKQ